MHKQLLKEKVFLVELLQIIILRGGKHIITITHSYEWIYTKQISKIIYVCIIMLISIKWLFIRMISPSMQNSICSWSNNRKTHWAKRNKPILMEFCMNKAAIKAIFFSKINKIAILSKVIRLTFSRKNPIFISFQMRKMLCCCCCFIIIIIINCHRLQHCITMQNAMLCNKY